MKRSVLAGAAAAMLIGMAASAKAEVVHRIGGGVHYWTKIGDMSTSAVDKNGLGWLVSYQVKFMPLLRLEADVELLPDKYGGSQNEVFAPQAFVLVGFLVYGGVGAGTFYDTDNGFADHPFYVLRAGLDFPVLPFLRADLNVNYRFEDWEKLDGHDIDKDTLELGVALRLEL